MHSEYQAETYFFLGNLVPDDPGATPDDKKRDRANSGSKIADVHDDALRGETERTAR